MRLMLSAAIALALYPQCVSAKPAKINSKVDVNGYTYRVVVRGRQVKVIRKTIAANFRGRTVDVRREMIEAARIATGCRLVEDFWIENTLVGELACATPKGDHPAAP